MVPTALLKQYFKANTEGRGMAGLGLYKSIIA